MLKMPADSFPNLPSLSNVGEKMGMRQNLYYHNGEVYHVPSPKLRDHGLSVSSGDNFVPSTTRDWSTISPEEIVVARADDRSCCWFVRIRAANARQGDDEFLVCVPAHIQRSLLVHLSYQFQTSQLVSKFSNTRTAGEIDPQMLGWARIPILPSDPVRTMAARATLHLFAQDGQILEWSFDNTWRGQRRRVEEHVAALRRARLIIAAHQERGQRVSEDANADDDDNDDDNDDADSDDDAMHGGLLDHNMHDNANDNADDGDEDNGDNGDNDDEDGNVVPDDFEDDDDDDDDDDGERASLIETLHEMQACLDENSCNIPEGTYLELSNLVRKLFRAKRGLDE